MRVLFDTDIVLDVLLARSPFDIDAVALWRAHEGGRLEAFITPITTVNVFYIVRKLTDLATAR